MKTLKTISENELKNFIEEILIPISKDINIFLLKGDLASGKTTLVKKFAEVLKIEENVTSPTFSIQNIYGNKIFHYDIYQNGTEGFLQEGLLEELEKDGYHFIEWADDKIENILKEFSIDYIKIEIEKSTENKRVYKVEECIH